MEMKPLVYRGRKEIGAAVGISYQKIAYYIEKRGLPAFKIDGCKEWIALPDDLQAWIQAERPEEMKRI